MNANSEHASKTLKGYRKYLIAFCLLNAYVAILTLSYSSGYKTGNYFEAVSGKVLLTFTNQNTTVRFNVSEMFSNTTSTISTARNITLKPKTASSLNGSKAVTIETQYLMENRDLCRMEDNLKVVIMVHTAPSHFVNRLAIRKTWGNNSYYSDLGKVRTLFLLGQVKNRSLQMEIDKEFKQFGDLVQGDFIDSYYNMTLKGVMGYKWLNERCKNAEVILKTDDDVIVNMFTFLKTFLPQFLSKPKHMACRRLHKSRIERKKNSKWYINNNLFRQQSFYPDFCQGFMVAISNDVISELLISASLTPYFWIDDIYLYGLVPENVPNMHYTNLVYGKSSIWGAEKAVKCYEKGVCQYFVVLLWSNIPETMEEIWSLMRKRYKPSIG